MRSVSDICPELYPSKPNLAKFNYYSIPILQEVASVYAEVSRNYSANYSHIVFCPWLKRGGADLGTLHHLDAIAKANAKPLLVTTEPGPSSWMDRVPAKIDVLPFGELCQKRGISPENQMKIILRFLIQKEPPIIHIINSNLAWQVVEQFGSQLARKTRIYASLFCDDFSPEGQPSGYGQIYTNTTYEHITRIISDNTVYPKELSRRFGIPHRLFATAFFPCTLEMKSHTTSRQTRHRILWASRLDRQKRIDLLGEIAAQMPSVKFDVFGARIFNESDWAQRQLKALPNVELKGTYNGFESLPHSDYDAFLYTSSWDGLPNVLLEAASCGLPIIAPDIGGISDFVTAGTGTLVTDVENADAYSEAIRDSLANPDERVRKAWNARLNLRRRHNTASFRKSLESIGYLGPERA